METMVPVTHLCFTIFIFLGLTPDQGATRAISIVDVLEALEIEDLLPPPTKPGWEPLPVDPNELVAFVEGRRGSGRTPGLRSRRLDPSKPWLRPDNNWGQGWGQSGGIIDPLRPWGGPGKNWDTESSPARRNDDLMTKLLGFGLENNLGTGLSLPGRKIDPSRPWLRPGNNWGLGWPRGRNYNPGWEPVEIDPDEFPIFFEDYISSRSSFPISRYGRKPNKFQLLG